VYGWVSDDGIKTDFRRDGRETVTFEDEDIFDFIQFRIAPRQSNSPFIDVYHPDFQLRESCSDSDADGTVTAAPIKDFPFFGQLNLFNQAPSAHVHIVLSEDASVGLKDELAPSENGSDTLDFTSGLWFLGKVMFPLVFPTLTQHFSVTCCFEFDGLLLAPLYHATFCRSIDETLKKWQIDSEPFTGRRSKLAAQERDREKEREKFRLYRKTKDERLREELISEYRPLAEYLARQFADSGEPLEDLIQYALIGLIKAIEGYDPDRGVEFTTYAWYQIRGEISHYLRDQGKLISEPAWLQEARIKIERARNKLRQTLKREPTFEELVQESGLKPEVVRRVLETEQLFKVTPLDETSEEEEEGVTDLERLVVEDEQVDIEQRYLVRRAVEQLPELHRKVIEWLFWEDLTMTEIARLLGVSVTYVSYLYRQAIGNLRRILGVSSSEPPRRKKRHRKKSGEQEP